MGWNLSRRRVVCLGRRLDRGPRVQWETGRTSFDPVKLARSSIIDGICPKGRYTADLWIVWCNSFNNAYLSVICQDQGGLKIKNLLSVSHTCTFKYFMEDADLFSIRGKRLGVMHSVDSSISYLVSNIPARLPIR